jgi:CrcB protein
MTWLLVALGAAAGAPARYLTNRWVHDLTVGRSAAALPVATFAVNVIGSLGLGLLAGAWFTGSASSALWSLAGVGAAGAFTTFSTFAWETDAMVDRRRPLLATFNVVASVGVCLAVAAVGYAVTAGG